MTIAEVVKNDDFMPRLKEFNTRVRADVTGSSRYEYAHTHPPTWVANNMSATSCVFRSNPKSLPIKQVKRISATIFLH